MKYMKQNLFNQRNKTKFNKPINSMETKSKGNYSRFQSQLELSLAQLSPSLFPLFTNYLLQFLTPSLTFLIFSRPK